MKRNSAIAQLIQFGGLCIGIAVFMLTTTLMFAVLYPLLIAAVDRWDKSPGEIAITNSAVVGLAVMVIVMVVTGWLAGRRAYRVVMRRFVDRYVEAE